MNESASAIANVCMCVCEVKCKHHHQSNWELNEIKLYKMILIGIYRRVYKYLKRFMFGCLYVCVRFI